MRKWVGANILSRQRNRNCPLCVCLPSLLSFLGRTGDIVALAAWCRPPPHAHSTQQPAQVHPTGATDTNTIMKAIKGSWLPVKIWKFTPLWVYGFVLLYMYIIYHFTSFMTRKLWGTILNIFHTSHSSTSWYCLKITLMIKFPRVRDSRQDIVVVVVIVACTMWPFFWTVRK